MMLPMNSEDKAKQLAKDISKSLLDLLNVLGDIDEDNPQNEAYPAISWRFWALGSTVKIPFNKPSLVSFAHPSV